MAVGRLLGLDRSDGPAVRQLAGYLGPATLAELLLEGAVVALFLSRIGADALPLGLAGRAAAEVLASLGYERLTRRWSPRRALTLVVSIGVVQSVGHAIWFAFGVSEAAIVTLFVLAPLLGRLSIIHFGAHALTRASGARAARVLPVVYGAARVAGAAAGPALAILAGRGVPIVAGIAAVLYGIAGVALQHRASLALPLSPGPSAEAGTAHSSPPPPSIRPRPSLGRTLLVWLALGAAAIACARIALRSNAGGVLAAHNDEATLQQVYGLYFTVANLLALLGQVTVLGRLLKRGALPLLNLGWGLVFVGAAAALAAVPGPAVAILAQTVERELRRAVRTPITTLLYQVFEPTRRAWARTWVIGVTVPGVSVLAGLALNGRTSAVFSWVGITAAAVVVAAILGQNRIWRLAKRG